MYDTLNDIVLDLTKIADELEAPTTLNSLAAEVETIARELDTPAPAKVALSPLQQEYREYFLEMLEKHNVNSPASLPDEASMKAFFNDIKGGWVKGKGRK
jgi:hypothetical protein